MLLGLKSFLVCVFTGTTQIYIDRARACKRFGVPPQRRDVFGALFWWCCPQSNTPLNLQMNHFTYLMCDRPTSLKAVRMVMHACQIGPKDIAPPCPGSPYRGCIGARGKLATHHKRVVRDTSRLLSSDWLKITFIFCIWCVARLWRGQRLVSLEKVRNVFESVTDA